MVSDFPEFNKDQSTINDYIEELEMFMLAQFGQCDNNRKLAALQHQVSRDTRFTRPKLH